MESTNTLLDREYATDQLDVAERARLQELESIVEHGLQTFYEVGKALDEIREQKLYRETHKTFEAYCQEKWGMARQTANRFIGAARVMEILEPIGSKIPTKESQIRPLAQLPPELQIQIWQEAVESSPNGIPTGAAVKRLVEERFPSSGSGRWPKDSVSELEKLRSDNQRLREQIREQNRERDRRAAAVALELEQLRAENRQLKAQLRQRDKDWEVRLAAERIKIRKEVRAQLREEIKAELREEIRAEVKAEYEGQINSLTQQLAEMTANYHGVLARLTALEKGK
jgi:Cell shape-determining protein